MTPRRRGRATAALAACVVAGAVATACSRGDALALARQACGNVQRSIALYDRSTTEPSAARQADAAAAVAQLRAALPLAAKAAGEDSQWQALVTTLSESSRVAEADLVPALRAQCADAATSGSTPTVPSTTVAPVPTNPPPVGR
ncbi:MAG: hypothetical protein KGJ77_08380 [Acidobacteriota bacterium]|nr:hypothetical protein [Acidobacteriota bacterium]